MPLLAASLSAAPLVWRALPNLPDPEGFASAFAGVNADTLLVAGGANFPAGRPWEGGKKVWYDLVFALERDATTWRIAGHLPRPIAYGVSVTTSRGVVCVGGGDAKAHFADAFLLTITKAGVQTAPLPALPAASAFGSGAGSGSVVYLLGGLARPDATEAQATFWRLDLGAAQPKWENLPPCPGPARMLAGMTVIGDTVYVCGGVSVAAGPDGKAVRGYLADTYAYTPAAGWRRLADLPHVVAASPSPLPVTAQGELLVISGDDGTRAHLTGPNHPGFKQEVFAFSPVQNRWRLLDEPAPISRATAPTARWGNAWIIASGERRPGYRSPEVWAVEAKP